MVAYHLLIRLRGITLWLIIPNRHVASDKRGSGTQSETLNMFFHFALHVMEMLSVDFEEKQCLFEDLDFIVT